FDLSTQTDFSVTSDGGNTNQMNPAIWNNTVVWQDNRHGNWDIYGYDLSSQTGFRITDDPADQVSPTISGPTVLWQDARNGGWDLYGYDLDRQIEFPVRTFPADQLSPAIADNIIVWEDWRDRNGDIYAQQFEYPVLALQVEPHLLLFGMNDSTIEPAVQEVEISAVGDTSINWTATSKADWLNVAPVSGATPAIMSVSIDASNLYGGSYPWQIIVVGSDGRILNTPQSVVVDFLGTEVSGTIDADTTWNVAGSPYTVSGDVIVSEGVMLSIEPGARLRFESNDVLSSGSDPDKVELIIKGTLVADGVTFTSNADSPAAGDWYGIRFLDSSVDYGESGCVIENSTIEYGTVGISTDGASPLISNNTITEIKGNNADSDRDAGDGVGILVTNGSSPTITDNTISSVRGGDGSMSLYYPSKDSGDGYGICVRNDSSAVIAKNTISYVTGAPGQCNYVYVAGYASGRGTGILVVSSSPTIADNTVSNIEVESCCGCPGSTGTGIYLEASSPTIGNNGISLVSGGRGVPGGIGAGIFADNASLPTVTRNTISDIQGGDGENALCLGGACQYSLVSAGDGGVGAAIYAGTNSILNTDANIVSLISGGNGGNGLEIGVFCDLTSGADGGIGAGIYAADSSLNASNSIIYLTHGGDGGTGAPSDSCSPGDGGDGGLGIGTYVEGSPANLVNNTITSGSGGLGGASGGEGANPGTDGSGVGVGVDVASTIGITNNIVVSHTIGISSTATTATLSHNDVWGNSTANYSGVAPGTDDISADPLFVDPANDDYHLQCDSPAIDAGINEGAPPADFEGDPRPLDGNSDGIAVVDMGADEFKPIPIPVGGVIVRVSKLEVLAPRICLGLLALVAGILLVRRHIPEQG
ncbi:MAG: choice-of-anchor Q domain-containing protein, partial [Anaerolineae bacterium]